MPLCGRAVEILDAVRRLGDGESPVVFVNERGRLLAQRPAGDYLCPPIGGWPPGRTASSIVRGAEPWANSTKAPLPGAGGLEA